jgi:hypothetical protein
MMQPIDWEATDEVQALYETQNIRADAT